MSITWIGHRAQMSHLLGEAWFPFSVSPPSERKLLQGYIAMKMPEIVFSGRWVDAGCKVSQRNWIPVRSTVVTLMTEEWKKTNGSYLSFRSLSEFWCWFEVTGRFKEQLLNLAAWPGGDSSAEAGHRCSIRNEAGKYCRCVQFPRAADTNGARTTIGLCAAGASGSVQKEKVNAVTNAQESRENTRLEPKCSHLNESHH